MWEGIVFFFEEIAIFLINLWNDFLASFASVIEAIPVPDFLLNMTTFSIPDSVMFYVSGFQIPSGIAIIVSAYTVRFFIRRIPVIG